MWADVGIVFRLGWEGRQCRDGEGEDSVIGDFVRHGSRPVFKF